MKRINYLLKQLDRETIDDWTDITSAHANMIIEAMEMSLNNHKDWVANMVPILKGYMDVITMYTRTAEAQKPQLPKDAKPQEVKRDVDGKIIRSIFMGDQELELDPDGHPPIIT